MIISHSAYIICMVILAILFILPTIIKRFSGSKKNNWADVSFLLVLLLLPINWYTPTIITVNSCGDYTKEVLIFANKEYAMGKYNYVVNNSNNDLVLEYVTYQKNPRPDDDTNEYVIIKPKEIYAVNVVVIDFLFEKIPSSIRTKSDEAKRVALYCLSE